VGGVWLCISDSAGGGVKYSISQLAAMTGKDRRTVTDRLQALDFEEGANREHFYESEPALAAIYLTTNARDELDKRRCEDIALNMEIKRRERIPLSVVSEVWEAALQAFGATLKNVKSKKLPAAKINELIGKLRSSKLPLKW
jgi:hypothetical protein